MINLNITKKLSDKHNEFVDNCINALFDSYKGDYLITIDMKKFVDDDGSHAGFCFGDDQESAIDIATHFYYEDGEEGRYTPVEIASNLAHELVHAKQFANSQINMIDHVWKHGKETIDCTNLEYADTPWEVEAYLMEDILTDIFWSK